MSSVRAEKMSGLDSTSFLTAAMENWEAKQGKSTNIQRHHSNATFGKQFGYI